MGDSSIEWTEKTWNPVRGCVKISAGCKHCYAETFAERWRGVPGHPYEQGFDLRLVPEKLEEPLHWKKPAKIFVNSMSDLFQDGVPDEFIHRVFNTMFLASASNRNGHTFQILTKRPERMLEWARKWTDSQGEPLGPQCPRIWWGVSVEDQEQADERIPLLLQTPAAVRWISAEPLLGPLDIDWCLKRVPAVNRNPQDARLDQVVVGGESGPGARPFDLAWARSLRDQCHAAGTPFFMKQLGANPFQDGTSREAFIPPMRDKKGGDMGEWPEDLRIRQFPK